MTAFLFLVTLASARLPFLLLERPRRESHCQHGEHASALQSTSTASYSGDITMSASIGSTDDLSTNPCLGPRRSFYTFSHDRTIKRFPRIAFRFATCIGFVHCPSAFPGYFQSSLSLMLPQGFGDPIAGFANPHNETRRDTPNLTIGHTPWSFGGWTTSSRGAFAFAPRGLRVSTTATHGTRTVGGKTLFLYLFFVHGHQPRPRVRPRPRPRPWRGGSGLRLDVRVDVRRTEGRPPPSS